MSISVPPDSPGSPPDLRFGYCTNVHAGVTLAEAKDNLKRIATDVRQNLVPQGRLPVGLWLAQKAAEQLHSASGVPQFGEWLAAHGLKAYTFNGFPQGDFHQSVVKHEVYKPTWLDESRLHYTLQLADILAGLLDRPHGSISTLPLGWPSASAPWDADQYRLAGTHLQRVAEHLNQIRDTTGKEIMLAIEPEPGCVLDTAQDMVEFLQQYVFDDKRPFIRRHIGVCHDVCHSAVMFEPQAYALKQYLSHGVRIGKVQVSSAVEVAWTRDPARAEWNERIWQQLERFQEPRYLHQTTRQRNPHAHDPGDVDMVDDLPDALKCWCNSSSSQWPADPWRIHFHVPIFVEQFGNLLATRNDIHTVVSILENSQAETIDGAPWFTGDYEVETYAWGVLPAELRVDNLADGISRELSYLQSIFKGLQS